jgi:hypothetical protein
MENTPFLKILYRILYHGLSILSILFFHNKKGPPQGDPFGYDTSG